MDRKRKVQNTKRGGHVARRFALPFVVFAVRRQRNAARRFAQKRDAAVNVSLNF